MSKLLNFDTKLLADSQKSINFARRILFTRCKCLILNLLLFQVCPSEYFKTGINEESIIN